jgi:hypothetical protein
MPLNHQFLPNRTADRRPLEAKDKKSNKINLMARTRRDYSARTPRPFGAALWALERPRTERARPRQPTDNSARITEPCGRYLSASRLGSQGHFDKGYGSRRHIMARPERFDLCNAVSDQSLSFTYQAIRGT